MLPCPPEELRWFAGREDLVVEVRNNWQTHHNSVMFGGKHGVAEDPILAVVTVPLSSVNIEDEEEGGQEAVGDGRTFRRRTTRDGASSTTITIPLHINVMAAVQWYHHAASWPLVTGGGSPISDPQMGE